jgi:branched-chain amino acid transport system permease protein
MDISQFLQFFFSGLTLGSVYALMAVSLLIIYRVSNVISFAQGEFFVFGALIMVSLSSAGIFLPIAFGITVIIGALMGAAMERSLIRPVLGSHIGTIITMTIAISLALRGIALLIWGRQSFISSPFSQGRPLMILGASLQLQVLWIIGTTVAALIIIWLFFEKTMIGIAMRACAENPTGAKLSGINLKRISLLAWAWGSGLGALAGIVVAPLYFLQYASGTMPMVKGFVVIALGGLTSTVGVVAAGFFLGLIESFTIAFLSSQFCDAIVFSLLIIVLLGRTWGVFGSSDSGGF